MQRYPEIFSERSMSRRALDLEVEKFSRRFTQSGAPVTQPWTSLDAALDCFEFEVARTNSSLTWVNSIFIDAFEFISQFQLEFNSICSSVYFWYLKLFSISTPLTDGLKCAGFESNSRSTRTYQWFGVSLRNKWRCLAHQLARARRGSSRASRFDLSTPTGRIKIVLNLVYRCQCSNLNFKIKIPEPHRNFKNRLLAKDHLHDIANEISNFFQAQISPENKNSTHQTDRSSILEHTFLCFLGSALGGFISFEKKRQETG